jgi:hypothetical protein
MVFSKQKTLSTTLKWQGFRLAYNCGIEQQKKIEKLESELYKNK